MDQYTILVRDTRAEHVQPERRTDQDTVIACQRDTVIVRIYVDRETQEPNMCSLGEETTRILF